MGEGGEGGAGEDKETVEGSVGGGGGFGRGMDADYGGEELAAGGGGGRDDEKGWGKWEYRGRCRRSCCRGYDPRGVEHPKLVAGNAVYDYSDVGYGECAANQRAW